MFERFITLAALEWSFQGVRLHLTLQDARTSKSIVALVELERLLCCVHPYHVNFHSHPERFVDRRYLIVVPEFQHFSFRLAIVPALSDLHTSVGMPSHGPNEMVRRI